MEGAGNGSAPAGTAPAQSQSSRGNGRGRGRGGQSRGGMNGASAGNSGDRGEERSRGDSHGRGRGRGRGGRGGRGNRDRAESQSQALGGPVEQDPATTQPPPEPGPGGVFGTRLTKDAAKNNTSGESGQGPDAGDDEGEVCFICASPVIHYSVAPCNHRTCHICALRLRALYKTKACAHCRTEAASMVFTDDAEKRFEEYTEKDFFRTDTYLGIAHETEEIYQDTILLLRFNCPDPTCDVACHGWKGLRGHVNDVHHKLLCKLCTENKKVFTHEHELFTQQELRRHLERGDDNPGAIDQSGFQGHPRCDFCRERFYGEDELYAHCRDKHERCHLCDRRTNGRNPQYYVDYNALEQHFGKDHFPCLDNECLEKKFVVFDSEMDLKAHQLESHPNGLSKDARRDARRVDISSFDYRPQYQETRRGGRGGGRGRDPNSEPMPASSGAHMSRAELAHQREREIQSAQSVTSRTFGGQLSQPEPQTQTVHRPANTQSPRPAAAQPAFPALQPRRVSPPLNASAQPRPTENLTPQEQARRLRHAAVTERAANLLENDQAKLTKFRDYISSYRTDLFSASELIDAFFSLFDSSSAELGTLIKELADIFELPGKRDTLLKAWRDWQAINEDYPTLPPTAAGSGTTSGVLGASRVLKLKSSTAQSSRSPMSQQRSWGAAAASANNPFPALGAKKANALPAPTPGWLALRPAAAGSASSSNKPSPTPSRTQSSVNLKKPDAFPALPAAKKPTSTYFAPGSTGSGVVRQNTGTPVSAWGGGGLANGTASMPQSPPAVEEAETGKGKGRKGKQIMFKWG